MDPTSKQRPKPVIAVFAVLIPLVAIGIAAAVTSVRSDDAASTATTISQSGDPAAARPAGSKGAAADPTGATTTTGANGTGKTTTTTKAAEREPDTPTSPADAGPEGERASVTYPQPTVPPGGCSRPTGTAVITLGSVAKPGCLELGPDQAVVVRNRTGKEISFIAISVNEVLAPGSETRIGTAGSAFGDGRSTFWSPGNPKLSGIVVVG